GKLDLPGAVTVTAAMALLVYGLTNAAAHTWEQAQTVVPLLAAGVLLLLFVLIEARSPQPLMPLRIFASRNRSGAYAVMLTVGAALFSMFFFLTLFIQNILGFSPLEAGIGFLPLTLVIGGASITTSRLVGRIGTRLPTTLGPLLIAGGLLWLSQITADTTYPFVLAPMLLVGLGMGLVFVPLTLAAVSGVRPQETGLASALLNTGQQVGGAVGLAVLGTIASSAIRSQLPHLAAAAHGRLTPHLTDVATATGYADAFRAGAVIALGAFLVALLVIRPPRPGGAEARAVEPALGEAG
ncbi:MAG: MFS transporter, partial [Candidatus Dormiibacterota bacterium]